MASAVEMECPSCEKVLKVPPAVFGKKIKCKHCGYAFVARDPGDEPPAKPAKAAKPGARAAKPAASPPPPPPPSYPKNPHDDEDEGPEKITVISEGDDVARCPHCAQELDPPDAIVCIHCGFNNVTRAKAETKKVWAPSIEDWFQHLTPGVIALAICIGLIVFNVKSILNMSEWLEGSFLEMDDKDAAGRKRFFIPPGAFIFFFLIISLPVFVPAVKFAFKRLIRDFRPPEKIKK